MVLSRFDVDRAVISLYGHEGLPIVCAALDTLIPVLHRLNDASGWRFWRRWAFSVVISALESWADSVCGTPDWDA